MKSSNSILLFVTLPQLLLTGALIASLTSRAHSGALLILVVSAVVTVISAVYTIARRKQPNGAVWIALTVLSCFMLSASTLLLDGAAAFGEFLSPRLIALLLCGIMALYAVFALAQALAPKIDAGRYILTLTALPFAWFLLFNLAVGIRLTILAMILIVAGALVAVFLVIRIVIARGAEALATSGTQKIGLKVLFSIFSIALPLIGLALNASARNLLGDFSGPWFFFIPVLNGILLLLPPFSDKRLALLRFFLLSAALSYFVYFFVVFVPYLPLGIYALVYVVGVLLFAPAGALVMQIVELNRDRKRLTPLWGGARMALFFVLALLLIPVCLLTGVVGDRQNLENAMSYLETGEAVSGKSVDVNRLRRTLDNAPGTIEVNRDAFFSFNTVNNTPFLSSAYSALVLNGKVMRSNEINRLRRLFFDQTDNRESGQGVSAGLTVNENGVTDVRLTGVTTETIHDAEIGADRTWVNLTLQGSGRENSEYVALFTLPDGAYISDYYLDVGSERKYGILADERAAMAVYESIVRVGKDPGVIRYLSDRQLELRVFPFPFAGSSIRQTGFEIIHSQSFEFTLDRQTIAVESRNAPDKVRFQGGILLSGALKQTLPKAAGREPSYYFIVDSSKNSLISYQISLIEDFASMNHIEEAQVIFTSYHLTQVPLKEIRAVSATPRYGFNLALAVKKILLENGDDTVPVILFTSSNPAGAVLPEHSSWPAKRFPESPYYYWLRDELTLTPYAFEDNRTGDPVTEPVLMSLRSYDGAYVRDDTHSEIVPLPDAERFTVTGNQYTDALALDTALRSRSSMDAQTSLTMLRAGFRTRILTRQTAFIVVETSAQEAEIWKAQELLLQQDSTAARETLDEPPMLPMITMVVIFACIVLLMRRPRLQR